MDTIDPKIISSPDYDIHFFGIEMLHPFDSRKYSRAWQALKRHYGDEVLWRTIQPQDEVSDADLRLVHTQDYLDTLRTPAVIARALEFMMLASIPYTLLRNRLVRPMRLATEGTILAAKEAMQGGLAINLSGGYHHASAEQGEGFCLFADVPVAIEKLRKEKLLKPEQQAVILDLDAHQGNGHERVYHGKNGVFIFDIYNQSIYPRDEYALERVDYGVGVNSGVNGRMYMDLLKRKLPEALDRAKNPGVAFYIAGTDIVKGDVLGGMKVSEDALLERDKLVIDRVVERGIPLVIVLGGGYSKASFRMVARMAGYVLERYGDANDPDIIALG
jgi:histone deacetylase 11